MLTLVISLSMATACVYEPEAESPKACTHALIGTPATPTPTGEFKAQRMTTDQRGYGGDILVFKEQGNMVWAVHRVYKEVANEHRMNRLMSVDPKQRRITNGCVNVWSGFYDVYAVDISSVEIEE